MVVFLLFVIVCLLLNRKLGLVVLALPFVGLLLFVLALVCLDNKPTPTAPRMTYAQCMARFAVDGLNVRLMECQGRQ